MILDDGHRPTDALTLRSTLRSNKRRIVGDDSGLSTSPSGLKLSPSLKRPRQEQPANSAVNSISSPSSAISPPAAPSSPAKSSSSAETYLLPASESKIDIACGINLTDKSVIKKNPGLDLVYFRRFIKAPISTQLYTWCLHNLPWYHVQYTARGIKISTPRYTTVFGSVPGAVTRRPTRPIPPLLQVLREQVELATGKTYNFILLNFYQDGKNSISYHSDDESFLGPNPTIASLTLGGTRDFLMRNKADHSKREKFLLQNGDLIVMQGTTQAQWHHAIPKRAQAPPRINITFRKAINAAGSDNYYRYNVEGDDKSGKPKVYHYVNGKMQPKGDKD